MVHLQCAEYDRQNGKLMVAATAFQGASVWLCFSCFLQERQKLNPNVPFPIQ